jgi:hypothetical protein
MLLAQFLMLAPLARIALGQPLPSSLSRRRKNVSAPSFVQDSGARSWARMDPPTSSSLAEEKRLCSLLLSTAGARFADARSIRWRGDFSSRRTQP